MALFRESALAEMNELEYTVYNYIISNSEKIPYMTIRELADEAHVSTTTVLRLCKKVGCNGFSEFKVRWKLEREEAAAPPLHTDITALHNFLQMAGQPDFEKKMDEVAGALAAAKTILFLGSGNSGVMAKYASRYFSNMGKFAVCVEDPMFDIQLEDPQNTVVVLLSVSGRTSLMPYAASLRESKATVVSITNGRSNPLAKLSDYTVSYYVQQEQKKQGIYRQQDITTQFPVVYILEALAKKVYNRQRGGTAENTLFFNS